MHDDVAVNGYSEIHFKIHQSVVTRPKTPSMRPKSLLINLLLYFPSFFLLVVTVIFFCCLAEVQLQYFEVLLYRPCLPILDEPEPSS